MEKEDKLTIAIEEANTKLIEIINKSMMYGYNRYYAKLLVNDLITETQNELTDLEASNQLIENTILSLKQTFMREWINMIAIIENYTKAAPTSELGNILKNMETKTPLKVNGGGGISIFDFDNESKVGVSSTQIKNLRDYVTDTKLGGTSRFVNYRDMLNKAVLDVKSQLANGSLTLTDSIGRTKSIRNMAEIETRYKMITQDLKRQGIGYDSFVVSSSHADASERCSWWQGKIFLVDLDMNSRPMGQYHGKPNQTILGYIDGKPYYSLLEACQNGFLSFNCQHRLIKYYKGINPIQYKMKDVSTARKLTEHQRYLENRIRKAKRLETISTNNMKIEKVNPFNPSLGKQQFTEREYNILLSKYYQKQYEDFSKKYHLPIYRWRTRITEYEKV